MTDQSVATSSSDDVLKSTSPSPSPRFNVRVQLKSMFTVQILINDSITTRVAYGMTDLRRVELHHRAKFGRNPSNRCRDMAIFLDYSRWRPPPSSAMLDF